MTRARSEASDMDDDYEGPETEVPGYGDEPPFITDTMPTNTVQLLIEHQVLGRSHELGLVGRGVTTSELVSTFAASLKGGATVLAWPVNATGRRLRAEPYVRNIAADHAAFQTLAAREAPQLNVAPVLAPTDTVSVAKMLVEQQDRNRIIDERRAQEERRRIEAREAAIEAAAAKIAAERERLERDRLAMNAEQLAIADKHSTSFVERATSVNSTALELVQNFAASAQAQQAGMFKDVIGLMSATHQQSQAALSMQLERERAQAKLDADLRAARLREEREEREERFREEERREVERRKREEREHELKLERLQKEHDLALERERASKKGSDIGSLFMQFAPIVSFLEAKGLDLKDVFGMFAGGGPKSMLEIGGSIVEKVVDGVVRVRELEMQTPAPDDDEDDDPLVDVKFADGKVKRMRMSEAQKLQAAAQQQAQQLTQQPQAPAQPAAFVAPKGPAAPQAPASAPAVNPASALPLAVQKGGRRQAAQLRAIIEKHAAVADDNAFGVAVLTEVKDMEASPEFDQFVRALGFQATMRDAGLPQPLVARIVGLLKALVASGNFPADIPLDR